MAHQIFLCGKGGKSWKTQLLYSTIYIDKMSPISAPNVQAQAYCTQANSTSLSLAKLILHIHCPWHEQPFFFLSSSLDPLSQRWWRSTPVLLHISPCQYQTPLGSIPIPLSTPVVGSPGGNPIWRRWWALQPSAFRHLKVSHYITHIQCRKKSYIHT